MDKDTHLLAGVIPDIKHRSGCEWENDTMLCLEDCPCMCYEVAIFNAGMEYAAKIIEHQIIGSCPSVCWKYGAQSIRHKMSGGEYDGEML